MSDKFEDYIELKITKGLYRPYNPGMEDYTIIRYYYKNPEDKTSGVREIEYHYYGIDFKKGFEQVVTKEEKVENLEDIMNQIKELKIEDIKENHPENQSMKTRYGEWHINYNGLKLSGRNFDKNVTVEKLKELVGFDATIEQIQEEILSDPDIKKLYELYNDEISRNEREEYWKQTRLNTEINISYNESYHEEFIENGTPLESSIRLYYENPEDYSTGVIEFRYKYISTETGIEDIQEIVIKETPENLEELIQKIDRIYVNDIGDRYETNYQTNDYWKFEKNNDKVIVGTTDIKILSIERIKELLGFQEKLEEAINRINEERSKYNIRSLK